ncbi:MAG: hypothetical protein ACP5UF_07935 [Hydrogenobaculum sp.]
MYSCSQRQRWVGKTLISINLAKIIGNAGKKVLIIDGDFGISNAHIMLGLTPEKTYLIL